MYIYLYIYIICIDMLGPTWKRPGNQTSHLNDSNVADHCCSSQPMPGGLQTRSRPLLSRHGASGGDAWKFRPIN